MTHTDALSVAIARHFEPEASISITIYADSPSPLGWWFSSNNAGGGWKPRSITDPEIFVRLIR